MTCLRTTVLFALLVSNALAAGLPNQPAIGIEDDWGIRTLEHWSDTEPATGDMVERAVPDRAEFAGAESWLIRRAESDVVAATRAAFASVGVESIEVVATSPCNPAAVRVLDASEDATGQALFITGRRSGVEVRGIALTLYGRGSDGEAKSGVHAFVAPADVFVALGGYAIVAVKWLQASAAPDEDMSRDGSLDPAAATDRLGAFFSAWVENYVIPMVGLSAQMQMQSIRNMQTWNDAMNACAGDPSCSVVPASDGSGNWEAVVR